MLAPPLPPKQLPESTQIVPAASGKLILRAAVGLVKPTVVVLAPLVAVKTLAAVPCTVKAWAVAPTVKAPPFGLMLKPLEPSKEGVVTLVEKVGLFVIVRLPAALKLRLPLALTARVPEAFGTLIVRLAVSVVWLKVLVKPSAVPSLKISWPTLLLLPSVRPVLP